ncbi:MAG: aspartate aminotransferase family protein [Spirochaetales bacterium]|nr:MAG: aspartate aminotransferase family protein [Spirochaetales bacterium]
MNFTENEKKELLGDAVKYIIPHFANYKLITDEPKIFVRGEGCYLYDINGKRYLDTFASLLTTICGHQRAEVDQAIREQLDDLEFFPNYVDTFTVPLIRLASKLADITPEDLSASFFVNSGSEANETAIKMARQYHFERGEPSRYKVLFRRYSYHGTTLGGVSATGLPWFREYFEPLLPGFIATHSAVCHDCELQLDPGSCGLMCLKMIERQIQWEGPNKIAAFIMDPIPGSNIGFPVPKDGYIQGIRALCDKYGILLIFDEVQTGFGKTGKMFACEHWNVAPDILTIGKGFTGGYIPLAAAIAKEKIYSVFRRPGHEFRSGSTYGGHTIACAATLANIKVIEENQLVKRAAELGDYLKSKLETLRQTGIVGRISGIGLLQAVFIMKDAGTGVAFDPSLQVGNFIREYCYKNGFIIRNNGDIIVFAPALIITKEQIDETTDILEKALREAVSRFIK